MPKKPLTWRDGFMTQRWPTSIEDLAMLRHRNDDRVELGRDFVPIDSTVAGWTSSECRGDSLHLESGLSRCRIVFHGVSREQSGPGGASLRALGSSDATAATASAMNRRV